MKYSAEVVAMVMATMTSTGAFAQAQAGNSVVSVNSGCSMGDQGVYFATTMYLLSGTYYLNRTIVENAGTNTAPIYVPVIEHWGIVPNANNTGGSYGITLPAMSVSGYPASGTYSGAIVGAYGGYSFSLGLSCGSTLTGAALFSG